MQSTTEHDTSTNQSSVFDPQKIERHFNTSPTRALAIIEIVDKIIEQGTSPVEESRRALQRAQPAQAAFTLHQLKGSLRNFGAMRVCGVAKDIEYFLQHRPNDSEIDALFDHLACELDQFCQNARQWLAIQKSKKAQEHQYSSPDFEQNFQLWLDQLADSNMQALETFTEIQSELGGILPPECMLDIDENLSVLNFEAILGLLHEHKVSGSPVSSVIR